MNRTLSELIRDTEPFPDKLIGKLPPRDDAYVPWLQYAQRLLLHYGGYTWQVNDVQHDTTVWVVVGTLFLGEQPDNDSQSYSAVGEDSSATAAEANAFKRACSRAGIGLHLYEDKSKGNPYWLHDRLIKQAQDLAPTNPVGRDPNKVYDSKGGEHVEGEDLEDAALLAEDKAYADDDPERPF